MLKELHLYLDYNSIYNNTRFCCCTYQETLDMINRKYSEIICTSIPNFLSWDYAERLFVHVNEERHEITMGSCEGTEKEIRRAHNLEKMLLAGAFDWYEPERNCK